MRFKETHEWVSLEGELAIVGISEFAQKEIGEVVYVELPKLGAEVKVGQEAVILESTKAAIDIYSPISGQIVEVNALLKENPGLLNQAAETKGWLFKLKILDIKEYESMLDEASYRSLTVVLT